MKKLEIPKLEKAHFGLKPSEIVAFLDKLPYNSLDYVPWASTYPYHPAVHFTMAYADDCLFLKYLVEEKNIRAVNNTVNGSVWEDSCVEFFVSWDNGKNYYNFEFNCIGTGLVGYGENLNNRELLPENLIKKVKFQTTIHNANSSNFTWEMVLMIPLTVFKYDTIILKKGLICRANFYKCGDLLPEPHFIAWSNIESEKPNFHLPAYFGELIFD